MRMTAFHSWEDLVSSQRVESLDQRAVYAEKMALLRQRYVTANIVPLLMQLAKSADVQLTAETQEEVAQMTNTLQNTRFGKNSLEEDQMPTEKRLHIERRALLLAKDELKRLQEEVLKVRVHYNGMVREKDTQLATMKQQYEARWKVDYQALRHANATDARRQEEERKQLVKLQAAARRNPNITQQLEGSPPSHYMLPDVHSGSSTPRSASITPRALPAPASGGRPTSSPQNSSGTYLSSAASSLQQRRANYQMQQYKASGKRPMSAHPVSRRISLIQQKAHPGSPLDVNQDLLTSNRSLMPSHSYDATQGAYIFPDAPYEEDQ